MATNDQREGDLVEPEGVNAGIPVDGGAAVAESESGGGPPGYGQNSDRLGQGQGEMLSRPGSENGRTDRGPGQEMSASEG